VSMNFIKIKKVSFFYIVVLSSSFLLNQQLFIHARSRDVTEDEARKLTIQALDPKVRKLPKLSLDNYGTKENLTFYQFAVTWDNPKGSVMVGFFAVNRVTGDVWKLVVCRRIESENLRRLQLMIRKQINLTSQEYNKFHDKVPCEP